MRNFLFSLLFVFIAIFVACDFGHADSGIPIVNALQENGSDILEVNDSDLNEIKAKWDYFVYMSKPTNANSNEFYFFYKQIGSSIVQVHDAYLSIGGARRQVSPSVSGSETVDRYFVDSSSPGSNPIAHLLTIDYNTGLLQIHDTGRVYSMPYAPMSYLGRFALIPGYGYYSDIPIGAAGDPSHFLLN